MLLSPLAAAALAWLLVLIAGAFGSSLEAIGLHQVFYLLLYLGSAGWLVSVPLGVIVAFVAIMRAVKRPKA